jgi:hypothetical protein
MVGSEIVVGPCQLAALELETAPREQTTQATATQTLARENRLIPHTLVNTCHVDNTLLDGSRKSAF